MKIVIKEKSGIYDREWFDEIDFEKLEREKIAHSSGFVFDEKGKMCIVNCKPQQGWCIPGGGIEDYDKTYEDTLIREVDEEADLELEEIKRFGYFKEVSREDKKKIRYSLRFIAKIKKIKPQTIDPATGTIPKRKFIPTKDFSKYIKWGAGGRFQLKKALEALNKKEQYC
jgi:ADP-ribose pyrophosphatase YjhB (NUDIX family)